MRSLLSLTTCAILLAACSGNGVAPSASTAGMESTGRSSDPAPSPDLASRLPSRGPGGDRTVLSGILGADTVEGGCGYLEAADGTRYEVRYPNGWRLELSPLQLTSPDGMVVARGGDEVTVRGRLATDFASLCQIGPIFSAEEVVVP